MGFGCISACHDAGATTRSSVFSEYDKIDGERPAHWLNEEEKEQESV